MIRVKFIELKSMKHLTTGVPGLPRKGDLIQMYFDDVLMFCRVRTLIYHMNKEGEFEVIEIQIKNIHAE